MLKTVRITVNKVTGKWKTSNKIWSTYNSQRINIFNIIVAFANQYGNSKPSNRKMMKKYVRNPNRSKYINKSLLTCKAIFKSITSQRHKSHTLLDFVMLVNIQAKSTAARQQLD